MDWRLHRFCIFNILTVIVATAYQSLVSIKKRCEAEGMTLLLAEVSDQPQALLKTKQFCHDSSVIMYPTVTEAMRSRSA